MLFILLFRPKGAVAILWKDQGPTAVEQAAENLGLRAEKLFELGIIDKLIPEPPGAAHMDYETTFKNVDKQLHLTLKKLQQQTIPDLLEERYRKIRRQGIFETRKT